MTDYSLHDDMTQRHNMPYILLLQYGIFMAMLTHLLQELSCVFSLPLKFNLDSL